MARTRADYAKKSPAKKKPLPGWLWLLAGLLVGLFAAFLFYLQQNRAPGSTTPRAVIKQSTPAKPAPATKAPPKPAEEQRKGLSFDFYDILKNMEVVIPEDELRQPESSHPPGNYLFQVGSFRNADDAETRKAELAMLGLISQIQSVTSNNGQTWHRVRLGPYTGHRQLDKVRRMLQDNHIEFIVMKEKG